MFKFLQRFKTITPKCGHATKLRKEVVLLPGTEAETKFVTSLLEKEEGYEYCHDCLAAMSIRCAWCGKVIPPGTPITLYAPKKGVELPEYAVPFEKDPRYYVGCLRGSCCDTIADHAGYWAAPGLVNRAVTAMEIFQGKSDEDVQEVSPPASVLVATTDPKPAQLLRK